MNYRDFYFWLQGFVDDKEQLPPCQLQYIREMLAKVSEPSAIGIIGRGGSTIGIHSGMKDQGQVVGIYGTVV
jgi:hypothetical protein